MMNIKDPQWEDNLISKYQNYVKHNASNKKKY